MKIVNSIKNHKRNFLFYYWIYLSVFILVNIVIKIFNLLSIDDPATIYCVMLWIPLMITCPYEGAKLTTFFDCNENDDYIMKFKSNYNLLFYPIEKISNSSLKKVVMEVRELCKLAIVVMFTIVVLWMIWAI